TLGHLEGFLISLKSDQHLDGAMHFIALTLEESLNLRRVSSNVCTHLFVNLDHFKKCIERFFIAVLFARDDAAHFETERLQDWRLLTDADIDGLQCRG